VAGSPATLAPAFELLPQSGTADAERRSALSGGSIMPGQLTFHDLVLDFEDDLVYQPV
jgi:hypothetical protein